jgi:hypothetical protein
MMADRNNLTTLAKRLRPLLKKSISDMGGLGGCFVCDGTNSYGGDGAFVSHTTAENDTAVGFDALTDNTQGSESVAVGSGALANSIDGDSNTAVGFQALYNNTTGEWNNAFGWSALYNNKTSSENTAIGEEALYNYQGIFWPSRLNTAVGNMAMYDLETGKGNIGIGTHFGSYCGEVNIFIGLDAGDTTNTVANTAIGHYSLAGASCVCGYENVAVGNGTLCYLDALGGFITQFSDYSGTVPGTVKVTSNGHGLPAGVTTGIRIYGTGTNYDGTYSVTQIDADNFYFTHAWTSDVCTLYNFGYPVWSYDELARDNVAVGYYAGRDLETGSSCVFIGADSGSDVLQKVDAINSIAIGANTYTTKDNQVVVGDANIIETLLRGSILIGTTTDGMTAGGSLAIAQDLAHRGTKIGFFNTTPIVKELKANHNNWANISDIVAVLLAYGLIDSA